MAKEVPIKIYLHIKYFPPFNICGIDSSYKKRLFTIRHNLLNFLRKEFGA